jgi:hypothetical protein
LFLNLRVFFCQCDLVDVLGDLYARPIFYASLYLYDIVVSRAPLIHARLMSIYPDHLIVFSSLFSLGQVMEWYVDHIFIFFVSGLTRDFFLSPLSFFIAFSLML